MICKVVGDLFVINYKELQMKHIKLCQMPDKEFMCRLDEAAQLACSIMWLKERGQAAIAGSGIINKLMLLSQYGNDPEEGICIKEVRQQFVEDLHLT